MLAKEENKSIASFAKKLILEALERREDLALSTIAKIHDTSHANIGTSLIKVKGGIVVYLGQATDDIESPSASQQ